MSEDKKVRLNEKEVTEEELKKEQEKAAQQKGVDIVEVRPGEYKKRIQG